MALLQTREAEHTFGDILHWIPAQLALWGAWQSSDPHTDLRLGLSLCKLPPFQSQPSCSVQILADYLDHFIFNIMNHFHLGPHVSPFISVQEFQIKLQCVLWHIQQLLSVSPSFPLVLVEHFEILSNHKELPAHGSWMPGTGTGLTGHVWTNIETIY